MEEAPETCNWHWDRHGGPASSAPSGSHTLNKAGQGLFFGGHHQIRCFVVVTSMARAWTRSTIPTLTSLRVLTLQEYQTQVSGQGWATSKGTMGMRWNHSPSLRAAGIAAVSPQTDGAVWDRHAHRIVGIQVSPP